MGEYTTILYRFVEARRGFDVVDQFAQTRRFDLGCLGFLLLEIEFSGDAADIQFKHRPNCFRGSQREIASEMSRSSPWRSKYSISGSVFSRYSSRR